MVLTNFECWAHGTNGDFNQQHRTNMRDLFNPTIVQTTCNNNINNNNNNNNVNNEIITNQNDVEEEQQPQRLVSHLSSNGYYGYCPQLCNNVVAAATNENNMMDVEQQYANTPPHATQQHNNFINRKKRFYVEDDFNDFKKQHTKRSRFENDSRFPKNYGDDGLTTTYSTVLNMDQDDIIPIIPVSNLNYNDNNNNIDHNYYTAQGRGGSSSFGTAATRNDSDAVIATPTFKSIHDKTTIKMDNICFNPVSNIQTLNNNNNNFEMNRFDQLSLIHENNDFNNMKVNSIKTFSVYIDDIDDSNDKNPNDSMKINSNSSNYDHYDDQLENLFRSIHGGGGTHMWRHLSNNLDEI